MRLGKAQRRNYWGCLASVPDFFERPIQRGAAQDRGIASADLSLA